MLYCDTPPKMDSPIITEQHAFCKLATLAPVVLQYCGRTAPWPSGKAELCKSSTSGSNPLGASPFLSSPKALQGGF
jgi:hypothetical protein